MSGTSEPPTPSTLDSSRPDVQVENHTSAYLVRPLSGRAGACIKKHVNQDAQYLKGALVVEPRYLEGLLKGMRDAGLSVDLKPDSSAEKSPERDEIERMIRKLIDALVRAKLPPTSRIPRVMKVRVRDVPYETVAHYRGDDVGWQLRKEMWEEWRGRYIEIDTASGRISHDCGAPCWDITGRIKEQADELLGPIRRTVCAHQVELQ